MFLCVYEIVSHLFQFILKGSSTTNLGDIFIQLILGEHKMDLFNQVNPFYQNKGDKSMFLVPDYIRQPPAYFHTRILVGPGAFLTQKFVHERSITHVINCAFDGECPQWWKDAHPTRYTCLSAIDSPFHNILDWYPPFEEMMKIFLREGNGVVYVHCQAGMNRSASLALAYVVKNFHQPFHSFKLSMLKQRPCMFQNVVFMNQVEEFINGCISREKDTRIVHSGSGNRDAGLHTQGDDSNPQGFHNSTG